jgi:DNA-directed RNA polymerase-3 subunit RPC5
MPSSPQLVAVDDSILTREEPDEVLNVADDAGARDVPGPSTLFMPDSEHGTHPAIVRPRSPPLPRLADSDDEDDEVVSTLPVYLSSALHPSLALFQYPLQHRSLRVPQWASDRGKRITTRVKEGVGRVEIEVPVDGDPKVWREERARELGFVPDVRENGNGNSEERAAGGGKKKGGAAAQQEKWGDKMRLRSEPVPVPTGAQFYSGIVHEGE